MYLREIGIGDEYFEELKKRGDFAFQNRSIASLYQRNLKKFKTELNIWKIEIKAVKGLTNDKECYLNGLGLLIVHVDFDFDKFQNSSKLEKKKMSLDLINKGIEKVLKKYDLDSEVFENAKEAVIKSDYKNEWIWKKPKSNPNRKFKAKIYCVHEIDFFNAYLIITNKENKVIKRKKIFSTKPDELIFSNNLGNLKWVSENEVRLYSKLYDDKF